VNRDEFDKSGPCLCGQETHHLKETEKRARANMGAFCMPGTLRPSIPSIPVVSVKLHAILIPVLQNSTLKFREISNLLYTAW